MGKLSDDDQRLLDQLTAKAAAPDADADFEIEIYDTKANRGARLPFSQGKKWLFESFGIGDAPPAGGAGGDEGGTGGTAGGGESTAGGSRGSVFGTRK